VYAGLVGATAVWIRRRHPLGFALAVCLAPLLLVSNLLFDIGATMGERLVYHTSFGFVFGVAWVAQRRLPRAALVALGTALLVAGGIQIVRRNPDWKNDDTLFLHDVTVVPNAALANANAGRAHLVLSQAATTTQERDLHLQESLRLLTRALELHPGFVDAWLHLATLYEWLGRTDEMEAAWMTARRLFPQHPYFASYDPQFAASFASQGEAALAGGDPTTARLHLERAVRFQPELATAWLSLGTACAQLADAECARAAWQRARELDPGLVEAHVRGETGAAPTAR
jgi:tetratricopeptide (TPR) repeat protein